jgi:hypothetical protein
MRLPGFWTTAAGEEPGFPSLARTFPSAEIVGLETSANALEHAKRDFPDFRFLLFDGLRAPFEDESFDLVFSYHVLERSLATSRRSTVGSFASGVAGRSGCSMAVAPVSMAPRTGAGVDGRTSGRRTSATTGRCSRKLTG